MDGIREFDPYFPLVLFNMLYKCNDDDDDDDDDDNDDDNKPS